MNLQIPPDRLSMDTPRRLGAVALSMAITITCSCGESLAGSDSSGVAKKSLSNQPSIQPARILFDSWEAYKSGFISDEGQVTDPSRSITTSEGQSYAMLRAVWMDDRSTFDKVWRWTQSNLKRAHDSLSAWKWGKRDDGSHGILDQQSATDADQDIAFALLMAAKKWKQPQLKEEAAKIISDIWRLDVIAVRGKPCITAGEWATKLDNPRLNPSYFAPYIYRFFAAADPDKSHDWQAVLNNSYDVLERVTDLSLVHLPPDWCSIDKDTGSVTTESLDRASDYSYDAMRVPWRLALDYLWNGEQRAKDLLIKFVFLRENWRVNNKMFGAYTSYGVVRDWEEPLATFGCSLPMYGILEPEMAKQIVQQRILSVYKDGRFVPERDYYNNNWAWFGLAAYMEALKP